MLHASCAAVAAGGGSDHGELDLAVGGPGLMTKREVRVLLLAELNLPPCGVLWDLGSGVDTMLVELVLGMACTALVLTVSNVSGVGSIQLG